MEKTYDFNSEKGDSFKSSATATTMGSEMRFGHIWF